MSQSYRSSSDAAKDTATCNGAVFVAERNYFTPTGKEMLHRMFGTTGRSHVTRLRYVTSSDEFFDEYEYAGISYSRATRRFTTLALSVLQSGLLDHWRRLTAHDQTVTIP